MQSRQPLVETKDLCKYFELGGGAMLHAVDKVSLHILPGETLGLVGESGCGKSTLGRVLVRMYDQTSGDYRFEGETVSPKLSQKDRRAFSLSAQMIFQDPYGSLNPRMTVGDIIAEGPEIHGRWKGPERQKMVNYWLNRVGLVPEHAHRFPHEFSGGQRQRIGIARSLALEPKFVVCDEPISALDVSVQAQVVTLLQELQRELGLTYLFIAHSLSMVRYISNRMAVMYLGKLVELGPSEEVYKAPLHPYSEALIGANPTPDPIKERTRQHKLLAGELASPVNPKPGCRFANRCPIAIDRCRSETPELREVKPGRFVACHLR
ncbi:MAG: ATP-binding cassette domain-containing protein [Silvanigrellales bacterium]|nr:ATP-binding cassette domain-containing protein [Silvanigrellales bacterium]